MPPVVEGEVIGFRRWQVNAHGLPRAIINDYIWEPGANEARCFPVTSRRPCPTAPGVDCHCGMNAYHDPGQLAGHVPLLGIVVGWGVMYVHENAWRAQYARCVAIIDSGWRNPTSFPGAVHGRVSYESVARYFGVPIVQQEAAEAFASEYGDRVPAELIPHEPRAHSQERG